MPPDFERIKTSHPVEGYYPGMTMVPFVDLGIVVEEDGSHRIIVDQKEAVFLLAGWLPCVEISGCPAIDQKIAEDLSKARNEVGNEQPEKMALRINVRSEEMYVYYHNGQPKLLIKEHVLREMIRELAGFAAVPEDDPDTLVLLHTRNVRHYYRPV